MCPKPFDPDFQRPEEQAEASVSTGFSALAAPASAADIASSSDVGTPKTREVRTDYLTLADKQLKRRDHHEPLTMADWFLEVLIPILIFLMVYAVVFFLLNIRYVFTEVHDNNLRQMALFFILGIVALNRMIAQEGSQESFLYIMGLGMSVGLYTLSLDVLEIGSVAKGFMNDSVWIATGFNIGLAGLLWWAVNRLTHECCIDENRAAGDIGILTGTVREFQKTIQRDEKITAAPRKSWFTKKEEAPIFPSMDLMPFDPRDGFTPKTNLDTAPKKDFSERPLKRHPGISIFYFSVPVMAVFVLGLPVVQHGGNSMILSGHFYMGLYTVCALMLLMLTSLGGLRHYFRQRKVKIPGGISLFWVGLGVAMTVMVVLGAIQIPKPALPAKAFVGTHQYDMWNRGSTFKLSDMAVTPMEMMQQSQFMDRLGQAVLGVIGLLVLYGLTKGLVVLAGRIGRRRDLFPRWVIRLFDLLERFLSRLTKLPVKRAQRRTRRIQRAVATCTAYTNPLSPDYREARLNPNEQIEYAYQALCALAHDMGVPRAIDQTPFEFIRAFPVELKGLKQEAQELTQLYVVAAYSPLKIDRKIEDRLRKFWITYNRIRGRVVK